MENTTREPDLALDLPLSGFGLSYEDIQRGKTGDFDYVRAKVRRRGRQFVMWGRIAALVFLVILGAEAWFGDGGGIPSPLEIGLVLGFLMGPPWFAKKQRERLEELLAPYFGDPDRRMRMSRV
jgi:hypothetical protein